MHLHQAGYVDAFPNFKQLSHNLLNVDFIRLSCYCLTRWALQPKLTANKSIKSTYKEKRHVKPRYDLISLEKIEHFKHCNILLW